jgi:hypothetical protein
VSETLRSLLSEQRLKWRTEVLPPPLHAADRTKSASAAAVEADGTCVVSPCVFSKPFNNAKKIF